MSSTKRSNTFHNEPSNEKRQKFSHTKKPFTDKLLKDCTENELLCEVYERFGSNGKSLKILNDDLIIHVLPKKSTNFLKDLKSNLGTKPRGFGFNFGALYHNSLEYVEEQTPEICLETVKQDGRALRHVKKQTPEICLEAVKRHGWALQFVKEQTPKICLEAVKQYGDALNYVKEQSYELCLEAVKQNGRALRFVKKQTPEICLEAVKRDGFALCYVREQNPEICLEAVKKNIGTFFCVDKKFMPICKEYFNSIKTM